MVAKVLEMTNFSGHTFTYMYCSLTRLSCPSQFLTTYSHVHSFVKDLLHCAIFSATCVAIFLLREALHKVELSSTFHNGLQQLIIPLHSVSPLQQLVSQFYGSFNKDACTHFLFFVLSSTAKQAAEKIAQCSTVKQGLNTKTWQLATL